MSQKVKDVSRSRVCWALGISSGLMIIAAILAILTRTLEWDMLVVNAAYGAAGIAAMATIAIIHARYVTRHNAAIQKRTIAKFASLLWEAEQRTAENVADRLEKTEEEIYLTIHQLSQLIRFDGLAAEVESYLKNQEN